ncbi:hypothetical protein GWK47_020457 [Chionoecetes opilio]|uniref:Uncharacterized protein n=1 Tax=Chionoecetes opilio TaxID=41210 RepID=A0A8J4XT83_CHIOP|nr:hypothetical protein GWK47_020457 [Chionoecetes opilio]
MLAGECYVLGAGPRRARDEPWRREEGRHCRRPGGGAAGPVVSPQRPLKDPWLPRLHCGTVQRDLGRVWVCQPRREKRTVERRGTRRWRRQGGKHIHRCWRVCRRASRPYNAFGGPLAASPALGRCSVVWDMNGVVARDEWVEKLCVIRLKRDVNPVGAGMVLTSKPAAATGRTNPTYTCQIVGGENLMGSSQ